MVSHYTHTQKNQTKKKNPAKLIYKILRDVMFFLYSFQTSVEIAGLQWRQRSPREQIYSTFLQLWPYEVILLGNLLK